MSAPPALVSIVVPCHDAARWLPATLESALAQTWPHCEVIVIDDGSTDQSRAVAEPYTARGVRVVAQPRGGASAARNHGLRLASGEYIQFLDADDLLTPDKIAGQVALLSAAGADCVATSRWGRFVADPRDAQFVDHAVFQDFPPIEYLLAHTGSARMMHPAAWLVPRAIINRAGPWNESLTLNDDGEYFARIALAARRIVFSATGASLYRSQLAGSLSRARERPALESLFRSFELIAQHLRTAEDSPRVTRALANYWQRLEYELYPDAPDLRRRAAAEVRRLGGSDLRPEMGRREQLLAHVIGWKLARRLQRLTGT